MFMMTTLLSEAFIVLFAGVVANGLQMAPSRTVWLSTLALMVLAFAAAGLARTPAGAWVGWLVQGVLVAISFAIPMMAVLAAIFIALWIASLRVGARIDRERAEREATERAHEDA